MTTRDVRLTWILDSSKPIPQRRKTIHSASVVANPSWVNTTPRVLPVEKTSTTTTATTPPEAAQEERTLALAFVTQKPRRNTRFKILTENTKAPPRAVALASYLGDGFSAVGTRAPPAKDLMAFGSVLQHNQHNIGTSGKNNGTVYLTGGNLIREPVYE